MSKLVLCSQLFFEGAMTNVEILAFQETGV